jgi:nucleotide-binding universal stress UspA family protein
MAESAYASAHRTQREENPFLEKILVATEFSPSSTAALNAAQDLARLYGSELILTHVVSGVSASSPDAGALFIAPEIGQAMAEDLDHLSRKLNENGIKSRAILQEGSVADAVEQIVRRERPEMVVIGTHGAHGFERFILGSTAEALLRTVSCPVMTIGPKCAGAAVKPTGLHNILYATSLKHRSMKALRYAAALAAKNNAHIEIVHAVEQIDDASRQSIDTRLQNQAEMLAIQLKGYNSNVTAHLLYGEPAEVIVYRARKVKADLIVLEVHREKPLTPFLPEGIAYRMVCSARCPVLTIVKKD